MSISKSQVPFDQREGFIWLDGKLVDWKDAKIHVLTHGLHYGSSVFEGERIYKAKIFKSAEHTQRFIRSAESLGMKLPFDFETIEKVKSEIVKKNNIEYGYMRALAWRGSEQMTIAAPKSSTHMMIAAWEVGKEFNKNTEESGLTVCISKWRKAASESFPCHNKIGGGYVVNTLAKHEALDKGFNDSLMLDYRGLIAEGSSSNFFGVKNGEIYTPIPDCFLNGITRQTVIELAKSNNIPLHETRIKLEDLKDFDEVFFTGSAAGVSPITQIEENHYKIGPITKNLIELYKQITEID